MTYRRFSLLLALTLLAGAGTTVNARSFSDVKGTAYETAFSYLSERKIVEGYTDGLGRPNYPLNRAEALKVLLTSSPDYAKRLAWYKENTPPMPLFYDIDQSAWYVPFVELGFEQNIITGYPDGTFRPGRLLTVEEAVTLLLRAFDVPAGNKQALLSQRIENRDSQWYTSSINRAIERKLVMDQPMLRLGTAITRGQFFDMVYRFHVIQSSGQVAFDDGSNSNTRPVRTPAPARPYLAESANPAVPVQPVSHQYASEQYFAISMPNLGVSDLTITHPEDPFSTDGVLMPLKLGVGHLFGYPGGGGKIMIYGHSSGYPWDVSKYTKIFRRINSLKVGEKIYITYAGTLYVYEVTRKQTIDSSDTSPFRDDGAGEELILYTCWPPDSIQQRYLVHALPVDTIALR